MTDTIFAQATAPGRAGVAIVRISGPEAFAAVIRLSGARPADRQAGLRWLRSESGERIDRGLVLCFPGPGSFTGEDVAELHLHGGYAVCRMVLTALGAMPGLRLAEPGEFTRRAMLNGRIDLAEVEGLGDLLAAETIAQQRLAMRLMGGELSQRVAGWRGALVRALALVEASIDFADDELPDDVLAPVGPLLQGVLDSFREELRGGRMAERVRAGFEVALVGAPNVGKSTLLNRLAGREAAITSAIAGTTRDVIEVRMDLAGLAVTVLDMAGIRESEDDVERVGVARARQRAAAADLRVFLVEGGADLGVGAEPGDLVVRAKADLGTEAGGLAVSGLTGAGVDALVERIGEELGRRAAMAGATSHARQLRAIGAGAAAVERALLEVARGDRPELVAAEVRQSLRAVDFLVGRVDVEMVLDVIFQSFCLGK